MSKVSAPTFVVCGLGDPKASPTKVGVADGLPVNIPVLDSSRLTWGVTVEDSTCIAVMRYLSTKAVSAGKSTLAFI